jgi:predicted dehydrogenase
MIAVRAIADQRPSLDPRRFQLVSEHAQVVLAATARPIGVRHAAELRSFVRRGGGLVLTGGTLAAWSAAPAIAEIAGWAPGEAGPETELIVRMDSEHPITQRLGPEWKVRDRLHPSEGPPAAARVLARASWRFSEQVVAYERDFGQGKLVYIGLRDDGSATYAKLLGRALLFAAGQTPAPPSAVGLLGYGAIGREHAASISATPGLRLAAVCDLSADRREAAARQWSVRTHATQEALLDDGDVDLVVVGTPPSAHVAPVLAALASGKHVVCEKPFALNVADADRMIDDSRSRGQTLTVFQSRRWDPDYLAMRDVVRSGRIGEPFYMESFIGGYGHPCDFWHSHEPISGGMIFDWGSHYFDWILELFPHTVTSVSARAHKLVWHDVTNADQVRVDLAFAGGEQASFLQSDIAAARKPKWYVLGTKGAIVGDWADAEIPADLPARVTVSTETGTELLRLRPRDEHAFYRNLADHLAWGERLAVPAEQARRNVAVMEAATQSIRRDGAPLKVEI